MTIPEIKSRLSLREVLHHYRLKPDKQLRLNCPFHADKTPSMQVYYKTQTAYCFSSNCKTHGKSLDVIDFIMYMESCTKHEAIVKAKELISGGTLIGGGAARPVGADNEAGSQVAELSRTVVLPRTVVLKEVFTYFKNAVHNSQPAKAYLAARGLDFGQTEVGYNSGQFHHGSRKEAVLIESCVRYGLLLDLGTKSRTGSPAYKPFGKWCICFALRNASEEITGLYFRSTLNEPSQRHFYLRDRSGLYPGYPAKATQRLILTESIIDAASLLQLDHIRKGYGVLALYGTNGFTAEHESALLGLTKLAEVIFFLNGDAPGRKAANKHGYKLGELLPEVRLSLVDVPEGEDVNSLLQADPSGEEIVALLSERTAFVGRSELFLSTEKNVGENGSAKGSSIEKKTMEATEEAHVDYQGEDPVTGLDTRHPSRLSYTGMIAQYAVLGGVSKPLDSLKVTLEVKPLNEVKSLDEVKVGVVRKSRHKVDLYEDSQVERTVKKVAEKLEIRPDLLAQDLSVLTDLLEAYREQREKAAQKGARRPEVLPLTAHERQALEAFVRKPDLVGRINELLGKAGIVGEVHNRLFLFFVAFSHKLDQTLHALIQGSSGSGKTRLMRQVAACMPPERVDRFTRISDRALYNFPETYFVHHLLCIEDMDGLSEEAEYAARELISGGELRSAVSLKNEHGQITEGQKIVLGPVASLCCTTKGEVYEDNMSRVFLIAVDESPEQTQRIVAYQNQVAAGLIDPKREAQVRQFLQQLVGLLAPYEVVNPYADQVRLPEGTHKVRRLNELFQGFIKLVTVVNQYQRSKDPRGRLIATVADVQTAIEVIFESIVLKVDELDGSLRQFFEQLKAYVAKKGRDYAFSRFEVRTATGCGKTQQHHHIQQLVALEYLQQYGFANRGFRYKISHWDDYTALRARIKTHLYSQLEALPGERPRTPDRTPAVSPNGLNTAK